LIYKNSYFANQIAIFKLLYFNQNHFMRMSISIMLILYFYLTKYSKFTISELSNRWENRAYKRSVLSWIIRRLLIVFMNLLIVSLSWVFLWTPIEFVFYKLRVSFVTQSNRETRSFARMTTFVFIHFRRNDNIYCYTKKNDNIYFTA